MTGSDCQTCSQLVNRDNQNSFDIPIDYQVKGMFSQLIGEMRVDYLTSSSDTTWSIDKNLSFETIKTLMSRGYIFRETGTEKQFVLGANGLFHFTDDAILFNDTDFIGDNTQVNLNSGETPNPVYEDCDKYGWDIVGYWDCKGRNLDSWSDQTAKDFEQFKIDTAKNTADALAATQKAFADAAAETARVAQKAANDAAAALAAATAETQAVLQAAAEAAAKAAADAAAAATKAAIDAGTGGLGLQKVALYGGVAIVGLIVIAVVLKS